MEVTENAISSASASASLRLARGWGRGQLAGHLVYNSVPLSSNHSTQTTLSRRPSRRTPVTRGNTEPSPEILLHFRMGWYQWSSSCTPRHLWTAVCLLLVVQTAVSTSREESLQTNLQETKHGHESSSVSEQAGQHEKHSVQPESHTDSMFTHQTEQNPAVTLHFEDHRENTASTQTLSPTQNALMQHAVKDLLGFKNLPRGSTRTPEKTHGLRGSGLGKASHSKELLGKDQAPRYMKKLYEKYKYGGPISNGHHLSNTVRSISATIGE